MRKSIILLIILVCVMSAQATEYFRFTNAEGVELRYRIINTNEVAVVPDVNTNSWDSTVVNYPNILCNSIRIPDTVQYNGNSYIVSGIDDCSFACVKNVNKGNNSENYFCCFFIGIELLFGNRRNYCGRRKSVLYNCRWCYVFQGYEMSDCLSVCEARLCIYSAGRATIRR